MGFWLWRDVKRESVGEKMMNSDGGRRVDWVCMSCRVIKVGE